jgi:hypothetical protein
MTLRGWGRCLKVKRRVSRAQTQKWTPIGVSRNLLLFFFFISFLCHILFSLKNFDQTFLNCPLPPKTYTMQLLQGDFSRAVIRRSCKKGVLSRVKDWSHNLFFAPHQYFKMGAATFGSPSVF